MYVLHGVCGRIAMRPYDMNWHVGAHGNAPAYITHNKNINYDEHGQNVADAAIAVGAISQFESSTGQYQIRAPLDRAGALAKLCQMHQTRSSGLHLVWQRRRPQ